MTVRQQQSNSKGRKCNELRVQMMRHWEEAEDGLQGLEHLPLKDFQRAARGLKAEGSAMQELGLQLRVYSLHRVIEFYS